MHVADDIRSRITEYAPVGIKANQYQAAVGIVTAYQVPTGHHDSWIANLIHEAYRKNKAIKDSHGR